MPCGFICANNCSSLYDSLLALRGWQHQEINGIEYELNSIITEKWEGKAYRLVIQRERRLDGEQDLWEGEYTYRCILTNDYTSTNREIVEFYNLRGDKERIFDDMNNGFGWTRLPKSFMAENTVFLLLTAMIRRSAMPLAGKAVLHLGNDQAGANARVLKIDDSATGVKEVNDDSFYDLSGRRVAKPAKGIYGNAQNACVYRCFEKLMVEMGLFYKILTKTIATQFHWNKEANLLE